METKKETLQGANPNSVSGLDTQLPAVPGKVLEFYKMFGFSELVLKQILANQRTGKCLGNPPSKPAVKRR